MEVGVGSLVIELSEWKGSCANPFQATSKTNLGNVISFEWIIKPNLLNNGRFGQHEMKGSTIYTHPRCSGLKRILWSTPVCVHQPHII